MTQLHALLLFFNPTIKADIFSFLIRQLRHSGSVHLWDITELMALLIYSDDTVVVRVIGWQTDRYSVAVKVLCSDNTEIQLQERFARFSIEWGSIWLGLFLAKRLVFIIPGHRLKT